MQFTRDLMLNVKIMFYFLFFSFYSYNLVSYPVFFAMPGHDIQKSLCVCTSVANITNEDSSMF